MRNILRTRDKLAGLVFLLSFIIPFGISTNEHDQDSLWDPSLNSFPNYIEVMEKSDLMYKIEPDTNFVDFADTSQTEILSNWGCQTIESDGTINYGIFAIPDSVVEIFNKAESSFAAQDYDKALIYFDSAWRRDTSLTYILTLIGDTYYRQQKYDLAEDFLKKAIARNFADYDAHWFLADLYYKTGKNDSANIEFITAHLLNRNHVSLKQALKNFRERIGRTWIDLALHPMYKITSDGHNISIMAHPDWIWYACVKAVWHYEPGFAEKQLGQHFDSVYTSVTEEAHALVFNAVTEKKFSDVEKIITDGNLAGLVYYELLAPRYPKIMPLLPKEIFNTVLKYADAYH